MTPDYAPHRAADPDTSREAAEAILSSIPALERRVLDILAQFPAGLTAEAVAELAGLDKQSITPRFAPLAARGLIHASAERRRNRSGRSAIVWKPGAAPC